MPPVPTHAMNLQIHVGDNLPILESMPSGSVDLIYIDPPFNTDSKGITTSTLFPA